MVSPNASKAFTPIETSRSFMLLLIKVSTSEELNSPLFLSRVDSRAVTWIEATGPFHLKRRANTTGD